MVSSPTEVTPSSMLEPMEPHDQDDQPSISQLVQIPISPGPEPSGDGNAAATSPLPSPTSPVVEMDGVSLLAIHTPIHTPTLFMSFDPHSGFNLTNAGNTATPKTNTSMSITKKPTKFRAR